MKEYQKSDGGHVIIGSLAEIDARFAMTVRPVPTVSVLPLFMHGSLPEAAVLLPKDSCSLPDDQGKVPRERAQHVANQKLSATFGKVDLLEDEHAFVEVVQDAGENITAVHILFGTKAIQATLDSVMSFAITINSYLHFGIGEAVVDLLPLLERELFLAQYKHCVESRLAVLSARPFTDLFASEAGMSPPDFGPRLAALFARPVDFAAEPRPSHVPFFCGGMGAPLRQERTWGPFGIGVGPYGIWHPSPPPAESEDQPASQLKQGPGCGMGHGTE